MKKDMTHIHLQNSQKRGFTIVELLIVIVVIGILAAITIVSYSGITARANTTSAQSNAQTVTIKAEIFNSETSRYPYTTSELTSDASKSYYLSPTALSFTLGSTQPASPNVLKFIKCGTTPNSTQADITSGINNLTGIRVYYWTYHGTPGATNFYTAGVDSGAGVACPAS